MSECLGVDYSTCIVVNQTWDKLKESKNYKLEVGDRIFLKMIEMDPKVRKVFGFTETEDVTKHPKLNKHGRVLFEMIDFSVGFLGPDLEPLKDDLIAQGERHVKYGVEVSSLPIVINAVVACMEEAFGKDFGEQERKAWDEVNSIFCLFMRIGMNRVPKKLVASTNEDNDYSVSVYAPH